jgi:hypothetical protein
MNPEEWNLRTEAAWTWIRRGIEVTGNKGSSHSYSPIRGWAKAYPETTGYLVETMFNYAWLEKYAYLEQAGLECIDWLIGLQLPDGAFPGLLAGNTQPSVFNTAQILFGLSAAHWHGRDTALPMTQAVDWLLSIQESDGAWRKAAYVPGFVPSYYTRAVWGVLKANEVLQRPEVETAMRRALDFYTGLMLPNGAVRDWGFHPGKAAFTHTIGYTFEGFLESALLLEMPEMIQLIAQTVRKFLDACHLAGKTAGRYDLNWKGDERFLCVTGNAQMSLVCYRLWEVTGDPVFKEGSLQLLKEILPFQILGANPNTHGAFPGSIPFWGPYQRFRYPNWGVKFFLDAWLKWGGLNSLHASGLNE